MFEDIIPYTYLDGKTADWYTDDNNLQYSGTFVKPDAMHYVTGIFACATSLAASACTMAWSEHFIQDEHRDEHPVLELGTILYSLPNKHQYALKKLKYGAEVLNSIEEELKDINHFALVLIRDCENGLTTTNEDDGFQIYHSLRVLGFV